MANLKVSSQELDAILGELESDLNGLLADTSAKLAKAREEDGSPSPGMGAASASPSAGSPSAGGSPAPEGSPAVEGAPGEGAPAAEAAPAEGAPPAGASPAPEGVPGEGAPPAEGAPGAEGGAEGGALDPQALEAEYAQLPLEELKAHYLAAKSALFAAMQGGGMGAGPEAGAPAGAPPAGPEAAPPAGPPAGAPPAPGASPSPEGQPPMAMSEGKAVAGVSQSGNGGQKVAVTKSETDALQAQVDALTKIVTAFVNKPMRKAVTGEGYVGKSEEAAPKKPMSANEVTAKLSELTRDPSLKKSDRDAINRFYEGTVKIDAIEHLLK